LSTQIAGLKSHDDFSPTDFSFHGKPETIQGPPDLFRRSIAGYYFSNGRPVEEIADRDSMD
jgi:hypothetical protein